MNAVADNNINFADDDIQFAIQQSLMMRENEKNKNNNMEMVQLQSASAMSPYEMDLPSTIVDPVERKRAIKQRIKAEEEAAFQESIRNLSEMEKQAAIYERIQAKNERKKQKALKRQKMLNAPSADQVAQQQAIMAQIAAQKQENDHAPPAAFQMYHQ